MGLQIADLAQGRFLVLGLAAELGPELLDVGPQLVDLSVGVVELGLGFVFVAVQLL